MQVQSVSLYAPKISNNGVNSSNIFNYLIQKNIKPDSFERQSSQISFTGSNDNTDSKKTKNENSLSDSLKNLSIKGKPFLLGLVTSAAMVKMGEGAEELLFDSDGYTISDDGIQSSLVNIDSDEQIIEFKGTGIEIDADNYDFVDWENGVFRNFDGSVDIDLGNNKFIDAIHGIFVDPSEKVSAIMDGDYLQPMAIPNFTGYQTWPYPVMHSSSSEEVVERGRFGVIGEWLMKLFKKDSMPETENMKDIFGNDMILAKDKDGDAYFASYMKAIDSNPIFAQFRNVAGKENVAEAVNNEHLRQYIEKNHPEFGMRIRPYMLDKSHLHVPEETSPDTSSYTVDPLTADLNKNGIPDYLEKGLSAEEAMQDANHNGIPDFLEGDHNGNLIPDFMEVDANLNGIPDFLENLVKSLFGAK